MDNSGLQLRDQSTQNTHTHLSLYRSPRWQRVAWVKNRMILLWHVLYWQLQEDLVAHYLLTFNQLRLLCGKQRKLGVQKLQAVGLSKKREVFWFNINYNNNDHNNKVIAIERKTPSYPVLVFFSANAGRGEFKWDESLLLRSWLSAASTGGITQVAHTVSLKEGSSSLTAVSKS